MVSHTHLIAKLRMSVTFLVVLSQEEESTVRCDGMLLSYGRLVRVSVYSGYFLFRNVAMIQKCKRKP
jgi:hypothetical protein